MDKSPSLSHRVRLESTRYYARRLLPFTRRRRAPISNQTVPHSSTTITGSAVGVIQQQQQKGEELMDSTAFTASVENVLSAYLNRNRDVEYDHGLVSLVAPVGS